MRIDKPTRKATYLTFSKDNGITKDTRRVKIVDVSKEEITEAIKLVYKSELARKNEKIRDFVKLTVQMLDHTDKQKKDEFSFRLYRCDVNVIEKIINYIDGNG